MTVQIDKRPVDFDQRSCIDGNDAGLVYLDRRPRFPDRDLVRSEHELRVWGCEVNAEIGHGNGIGAVGTGEAVGSIGRCASCGKQHVSSTAVSSRLTTTSTDLGVVMATSFVMNVGYLSLYPVSMKSARWVAPRMWGLPRAREITPVGGTSLTTLRREF